MGSTRRNRLIARLKFALVKRRRRKRLGGLKAIILLIIIAILALVIGIMINTFIQNSRQEETEESKSIYIPYKYLKKAYVKAGKEDIPFSRLLTYSAFEAKFIAKGYTSWVLRRATKAAKEDEEMTPEQKNLYTM